tara:strand:- start:461 stop:814 length:354 start_codon:yes stop_codon:yes gene_type:complete
MYKQYVIIKVNRETGEVHGRGYYRYDWFKSHVYPQGAKKHFEWKRFSKLHSFVKRDFNKELRRQAEEAKVDYPDCDIFVSRINSKDCPIKLERTPKGAKSKGMKKFILVPVGVSHKA